MGRYNEPLKGSHTVARHVSKQRFAELVEQALAELPEPFATHMEEVSVEIRRRPTLKQLKDAGLKDDELLLGLYHGRPRTLRSVEDSATLPDMIYVFQEDIELVSETDDDLRREVRTTVLHEIGHYFGMDEDDLEELGYR
jgi:predicted Zn-dependent protease with MMP-like domain